MVQDFMQIHFDASHKTWSSPCYPYKDQIQGSLGEKFLSTMRTTDPDKIIDDFYDRNKQRTAKEVYELSIVVAKNLERIGIKKGDVVVFFCINNEHVAVLTMGCILAGAIVNFIEIYMEEEYIDHVLNIVKPSIILYEEQFKEKCIECLQRTDLPTCKFAISIDGTEETNMKEILMRNDDEIDFEKYESVKVEDPQNEVAFLCLTSGTTGIPKVVQLTHTLIMHGCHIWWNNCENYEPLNDRSVLFSFSLLRWISQGIMLFESMLMGLKRVSSCGVSTGKYGLELLRKKHITHLFVAPAIFYEILLQLDDNDFESLKSLKMVQLGGEQPSTVLLKLARRHCVNAKIFQCYGMTEMSSCVTNDEDVNGGKLLPGYQIQILDDRYKPMGPNQRGQIAIKPPFPLKLYKGIDCTNYFNESGYFINGDYGFVDEKDILHVLSRYKDLIKSKDLVLMPSLLEHVVLKLPEVYTARLTSYSNSPEEGSDIAVFFIVLCKGVTTSQAEISKKIYNSLKTCLRPEELNVIKDIYYVDSTPVTTCGKVDRASLRRLALEKSKSN